LAPPTSPPPIRHSLARSFAIVLVFPLARASHAGAQGLASSGAYVRETWTVADGLPINTITAVVQTRDGYLWLGTNDGVVRFDGVRFTVYNASNTPEIPSNRVVSLHEDRAGALWIITEQGHLVRHLHGHFIHVGADRGLRSGAARLTESPDGTLVLATTNGVGILEDAHYRPLTDASATDTLDVDAGYGGAVRRRDGSIWIATRRHGVWRFVNGRLEDVTPPALRGRELLRITADPEGRLWLSDTSAAWIEDRGFREIRRPDGPVQNVIAFRYDPRGNRMWMLGHDGVDVATGAVARNVIRFAKGSLLLWSAITLDSTGTAWYANGPELFRDTSRVAALGGTPGDNLASAAILSVTIDREGSIWLGTRTAGLVRLKPSIFSVVSVREGLLSGNVYPVYEDPWGSVWVGALDRGVSRIDTHAGNRITNFPPRIVQGNTPPDDYPPNPRDFFSDRPDHLWVAALDGIRSCTLPAFRCLRDTRSPALANYLDVHAISADAQGRLWAGAANGVLRYDNGQWERVQGWPLGAIQVRAFANTPDGALWIATGGGGIVRHKDGVFTRVSAADGLPSDVVRALYVDPDGYLWIGTEGRGLARLDPRAWGDRMDDSTRSRRIARIGIKHGLYDEAIHRILADDAGRLWMNTNRGIFWVSRAELNAVAEGRAREVHSTAYTERDGLRNREGNGGVGSAGTRTKDGRLWFPTQDGVAIVDPRVVTARNVVAPVVVERVVAGDSARTPSGNVMEIGVHERDLSIEYTALSLIEPKNLRFRYRLDPYDAGWVDAANRRVAFYTQVPPGRYTFRVQASSAGGGWPARGTELPLSLAYRPWETWPFRVGLLLIAAAATAATAVWWSRRVRRRAEALELLIADRTSELREREQQLALQNVRLSELDRAKSRFFANVSHEFRTPLTLTIGPLEGLVDQLTGGDGKSRRALDMALRNARRLMRLVNQILDVAKLEAGQMRLNRRPLDLATFVRGIAEAFVPAANAKGVALDIEAPATILGAFDNDALEKIVTNLLSNAVKFTPGGGRITLALFESDAGVTLRAADTGPGIPAEHLPHVFERFYQVDESLTRSEVGTGIGLALVQELVTLHGGTVTVSSGDLAPGAVFTVTLPLGAPDADTDESSAVVLDGAEPGAANAQVSATHDGGASTNEADLLTLLIVDDSADLRAYVRDAFGPRFRVLEAANGAEGIDVARRALPDVVVSDLMMPGTDGHALVRALRASPETDFLPIVLLTAHAAMDQRLAGLAGGADDYLTKPFDMRELAARVDNLIAQRRRLRERLVAAPPAAVAALPEPERNNGTSQLSGPGDGSEPRLSQSDEAFVAKVEAAIAQHLANPEFGVSELARAVAQERTYLFRRTRQLFGESPSDLIRRARLERAATLLAQTEERVADVAYAAGFNSVSYFSQAFLAAYGVTPSGFRQRATRE
jgi:signal transduction histidine kinase/ligand-binding sensor domain-containing protein/CheY-like chemotaxis protein/AraC-like DNA-binding protein